MKINKLKIFLFLITGVLSAQVGIGNTSPKSTLDVTGQASTTTVADGIIAPRLTGDELAAKDAAYLTDQIGAQIYVTAPATTPAGKTINITSAGYYFFDGSVWQPLNDGKSIFSKVFDPTGYNKNYYSNTVPLTSGEIFDEIYIGQKTDGAESNHRLMQVNRTFSSTASAAQPNFYGGFKSGIIIPAGNSQAFNGQRLEAIEASVAHSGSGAVDAIHVSRSFAQALGTGVVSNLISNFLLTDVGSLANVTSAVGVNSWLRSAGTVTTDIIGFRAQLIGGNPISTANAVGLDVLGFTKTNTTNSYGIRLAAMSNAQNSYGLKIGNVTGSISAYAIQTGTGDIEFGKLAGIGSRMVVADVTGKLSTQAIPAVDNLGSNNQTVPDATVREVILTNTADLNIDSNTLYVDGSANNVGIGTATPTAKLDIAGNGGIVNYANVNLGNSAPAAFWDNLRGTNRLGIGWNRSNFDAEISFISATGGANGGFRFLNLANTTNSLPTTLMTLAPNGNVGIGTTINQAALSATLTVIRGTGTEGTAEFRGTNRNSNFNAGTDENTYIRGGKTTSDVIINDNGGQVGIGTTTPDRKLAVSSTIGNIAIFRSSSTAFANVQQSNDNSYTWSTGVEGSASPAGVNNFSISDSNVGLRRLSITPTGNVGIGTTTPTEKLHVIGNILASGTITPDYVFQNYFDGTSALKNDYNMMSLKEVEAFAKANKHLPGVPSAKEVEEKGGIILNRQSEILLEKVEELFLHTIEQQKQIDALKAEIINLKKNK